MNLFRKNISYIQVLLCKTSVARVIYVQYAIPLEQFLSEPGEILRGCPLIIEVLIPTPGARKAFDSARLYHHIPIEDGQIPTTSGDESYSAAEDIFDEPYEEHYGI